MVKVIHHPKTVTSIARYARICCRRHALCFKCGLAEFSIGLLTGVVLAFMIAKVMW